MINKRKGTHLNWNNNDRFKRTSKGFALNLFPRRYMCINYTCLENKFETVNENTSPANVAIINAE